MAIAFPGARAKDSVAQAIAHVERLHRAELDLSAERQQKAEQLARAQAQAGADALDMHLQGGGDRSTVISLVSALANDLAVLDKTIEAARQQRLAAIPQVWLTEAEGKRAEARTLRELADKRQTRTDRLLAELQELEGVSYAPTAPRRPDHSPVAGGAPFLTLVATSKTELLRLQAAQLEREAAQLFAKRPSTSGYLLAQSRQEVLDGLSTASMSLWPALGPVVAFLDAGEATVRAQRAYRAEKYGEHVSKPAAAPVAYEIHWKNGELDLSKSRVREPGE